jgi:hypothetical protein
LGYKQAGGELFQRQEMRRAGNCYNIAARYFISGYKTWHRTMPYDSINQLFRAERGFQQVCHKCAVRFDPMRAKALLFNTRPDCFRAGLVVGK